jgi:hypothetical protein
VQCQQTLITIGTILNPECITLNDVHGAGSTGLLSLAVHTGMCCYLTCISSGDSVAAWT